MEKILQKLLAVEKKACSMVEEAENEERKMPQELAAELNIIRAERMERAKTRLTELTEEEEKSLAENKKESDEKTALEIKKLNEIGEKKSAEWARQIFNKIISTEDSGV